MGKKKKEKKKNANVDKDRGGKRERVTCESIVSKIFYNCVGELVVWRINKIADLSIFLLL